ncbi:iron-sulfur cluster biosynthesis family protein [Rapidithrix thailandica]|uniref:Iron-sulfur cluster biosynthesis family protein n=1 Tax=Rapidithrix thailandica TaxID=413964 RepID=A0AAW9S9T8_9BACT
MEKTPIKITDKAAKEILYILENKNIPEGYGLRIGIRGGGCGAAGYFLGFDKQKEGDEAYQIKGVKVYFEKKYFMYLLDVELDFEERTEERGFVFNKGANA